MGIAIVAMINNTALQQQLHVKQLKDANPLDMRNALNNSYENYQLMKRSQFRVAARNIQLESFRMEANISSSDNQEHCRFSIAHGKSSVLDQINM